MKLERMLSIIVYLLNHEKVKAQELADKFEVSLRTIYRDMDALSQAGIPIVAYQGADGGFGVVDGYKLDKSVLTKDEVFKIVAGLKGLHSISGDIQLKVLIEKLSGLAGQSDYLTTGNEIMIDLSPWNHQGQLASRIRELKQAIRERRIIEFTYYSNEKLAERRAEPCVIVFKEASWYLYAWCLLREDFRLFKLRRMNELRVMDSRYQAREFSLDRVDWSGETGEGEWPAVVALFDGSMKYAVTDVFGANSYEALADGRLKVSFRMRLDNWLYGFILGFGDKIEIVEPLELRDAIKTLAESIGNLYRKT